MRKATLAAVASVLLLEACGGGGGPSKATFLTQANQICKRVGDADATARSALGASPPAQAMRDYIGGTFAPEVIQAYEQIKTLAMPANEKDRIIQLLTDAIAEVRLINADPATGGNIPNQQDLVRRFGAEGMTECGVGFSRQITKPEFLRKLNAICVDISQRVAAAKAQSNVTDASPPEQQNLFVKSVVVPLQLEAADRIEALGFPVADQELLTRLMADARADIAIYERDPAKYFVERPTQLDLQRRWQAYGGPICAFGG